MVSISEGRTASETSSRISPSLSARTSRKPAATGSIMTKARLPSVCGLVAISLLKAPTSNQALSPFVVTMMSPSASL